ncbi:hypothetical protein [Vallitalea sp.]|uniref:hypothetical protein n=1 Tax=Vallitalea sp. TaxID=1882829 RepID=UPI0025CBF26B|nr:hypothetical protein [Vallitalea sp.]MCT4686339.1 hypothetical protein [Vallitalea sp.]
MLKRYKYVGKERDEETGLYYYGARYYAAMIDALSGQISLREFQTEAGEVSGGFLFIITPVGAEISEDLIEQATGNGIQLY